MTAPLTDAAADAAITAACASLHLPAVRTEAAPLADAAARDPAHPPRLPRRGPRRRGRRPHRPPPPTPPQRSPLPPIKTLEAFDTTTPVDPAVIVTLAAGTWIDRGEPVVLLGDSGTGKTHLLIGAGIAACDAGRSVRYITAAALVNELVEAADDRTLSKTVARYARIDLLCLDELGCAPRGAAGSCGDEGLHRRSSQRPVEAEGRPNPGSGKRLGAALTT